MLRKALTGLVVLFALGYAAIAIRVATVDNSAPPSKAPAAPLAHIAIFGASGTAGDGILKAALADPNVESIRAITRRETPRMTEGAATGKLAVTIHLDYLDYAAIHDHIADVDAVFWALGTSSVGVEEERYRLIHVDFPRRFLEEWLSVTARNATSLHYISSSDISEDSSAMWARVKVEAEQALFALAQGTNTRVVAYRPDYIGPTDEEAHLGQRLVCGFFRPVGAAVKATEIGNAMLEVSLRGNEFEHGSKLSTFGIRRYSDAYDARPGR